MFEHSMSETQPSITVTVFHSDLKNILITSMEHKSKIKTFNYKMHNTLNINVPLNTISN